MRSRDRDHPGQHGETLSTKNTKISWAWWRVPVIPATEEAEVAVVSQDRTIVLQPGQRVKLRLKKKKRSVKFGLKGEGKDLKANTVACTVQTPNWRRTRALSPSRMKHTCRGNIFMIKNMQ